MEQLFLCPPTPPWVLMSSVALSPKRLKSTEPAWSPGPAGYSISRRMNGFVLSGLWTAFPQSQVKTYSIICLNYFPYPYQVHHIKFMAEFLVDPFHRSDFWIFRASQKQIFSLGAAVAQWELEAEEILSWVGSLRKIQLIHWEKYSWNIQVNTVDTEAEAIVSWGGIFVDLDRRVLVVLLTDAARDTPSLILGYSYIWPGPSLFALPIFLLACCYLDWGTPDTRRPDQVDIWPRN